MRELGIVLGAVGVHLESTTPFLRKRPKGSGETTGKVPILRLMNVVGGEFL